ncbi:hypothetical protein Tco_0382538 [Tanacetum coccineum]
MKQTDFLLKKLQEQEREQFTIEERAKFLHDTIAAQRKFLARQRSEAIRNRPPTKNQLRNQMMTYLKHVGNFKHSELRVEDDTLITKMNKKDSSKGEEIKQESKVEVKEEDKGEENTRKRKHTPDEDKEVDYEILDKKYPIIDWKTENLGTKPQFDESKRSEEINMNVVTRSNGQKRYLRVIYPRANGYCESRLMQLNELAELEDGAYENTRIYKKRTKKWDDSRLRDDKDFKGDIDKEDDEVIEFENGVMTLLEKKSTLLVKYLQYGILAHKLNLENLPGKYQGSFSF